MTPLDIIAFSALSFFMSLFIFLIAGVVTITAYILKKFHTTMEVQKHKAIYMRQARKAFWLTLFNTVVAVFLVVEKYSEHILINQEIKTYVQTLPIRNIIIITTLLIAFYLAMNSYFMLERHIGSHERIVPEID